MGKISAARLLDLSNKVRWYIVASQTQAVIYSDAQEHRFQFVERISNPDGALHEAMLDSDKPGKGSSSAGSGTIRHALDRRSKRHEQLAKRFAKKLGRVLDVAQREGRFGNLVLAAEPHFLGLLRESMTPAVRGVISHEIGRLYEGSDEEIQTRLRKAIESP